MEILLTPARVVPEIFVERLRARAAGKRVLATTMSIDFSDNPVTDGLVEYGLPGDILAVDYFGHANGAAASLFGQKGHKPARDKFERNFSGSYVVLGEPEREKYLQGKLVHRSHIKALAVGSQVSSLGSVNFAKYNFENCVDAMLDFESPEFVDFLASFLSQDGNLRGLDRPGTRFALDEQSEVLIDYGKDGQSLIMESVFADITEKGNRSVTMSSTYMPAGYMYAGLQKAAYAGAEVVMYTNSLTKYRKPHHSMMERRTAREDLTLIALSNLATRRTLVPIIDSLPKDKFNHFKAVVIKKEDESKVAYIGSHNFHPMSVGFGTAEVALRTTDAAVVNQIETFIADNLAPTEDKPKVQLFGLCDIVAGVGL